jgi:hypothetical protein
MNAKSGHSSRELSRFGTASNELAIEQTEHFLK